MGSQRSQPSVRAADRGQDELLVTGLLLVVPGDLDIRYLIFSHLRLLFIALVSSLRIPAVKTSVRKYRAMPDHSPADLSVWPSERTKVATPRSSSCDNTSPQGSILGDSPRACPPSRMTR